MKHIGIISDTHAHWDPKYVKYFEECDEIWHAGDIGSVEIIDRLSQIKPIKAVFGNIDGAELRRMLPQKMRFKCENVEVFMTHIGGYPGHYDSSIIKELYAAPPQLMVCGHSHILKVMYDKQLNMLHVNPGAAGLQGWQTERTILRLTIDDNRFTDCQVITLNP